MTEITGKFVITSCVGKPLITVRRENEHLFSIAVHTSRKGEPANIGIEDAQALADALTTSWPTVTRKKAEREAAGIMNEPYDPEALRAAEDAEDAAEADAAMDEPGDDVPWDQVKEELDP